MENIYKIAVLVDMVDRFTTPMARIRNNIETTVNRVEDLNKTFSAVGKTGAVVTTAGIGMAAAILAPAKATFTTKDALGELASVGVKDLKTLEVAAVKFSDTWAGTTKAEFITAAYDIKSGISKLSDTAVAKYTEMSGVTAKATKATVGEMTSLFATGYGIYKDYYNAMSDIEFGEMFSAGIAKSVQSFKTTGSEMAASISSLGASATTANVPLEEQLSILGMLQATMSGSEAGTKYRAFIKSAAKAGDELGLAFTDANNQLLSMPEILAALKGRFGETIDASEKLQLQKAFGTEEAVALIDLLYSKTGDLQSNIVDLQSEMSRGMQVAGEMADVINQTEGNKFDLLKQKISNVRDKIGDALLPTANELMDKVDGIVTKTSAWIDKNQDLVRIIAQVGVKAAIIIIILGALITTFGTLGYVITKGVLYFKSFIRFAKLLKSGFTTLRIAALYAGDGIKALGRGMLTGIGHIKNFVVNLALMAKQAIVTAVQALPGLIASVWSFTAALLANPITWVIVGIVALIAAIVLLWQNWDSVTAWLKSTWDGFINGIVAGFNWIKGLFSNMPVWLQIAVAAFMPFIGIPLLVITHWGEITGFFKALWTDVNQVFRDGIQGVKDFIFGTLGWFKESGAKIMTTFTDGIKSAVSAPIDAVKGGLAKIREMLPFSDAKVGPLSKLTLSGKRVFTTITEGMQRTKEMPAQLFRSALTKAHVFAAKLPFAPKGQDETSTLIYSTKSNDDDEKTTLKERIKEIIKTTREESKESESNTTIEKLIVQVDITKIKDLPLLYKLLDELKEHSHSVSLESQLVSEV